ncbi:Aspartate aminotransferase [uncultured delta proteobacterium]|uniref:Aminotransferase n=1 Tax=uncultured delta proteobacterium TaxID=34034 RepID=A0A212IVI9_9DELT|nr:Aspartate aminotransferase [uncultured delta proteobacterium]
MNLSRRINNLAPSATLAMSARARELKAAGHDVLSLTVGEPDFPTPDYIGEAAKKAIDEHFTRYTAETGIVELRAAVAAYFKDAYGVTAAKADNITMTNGGKQGLYNVFLCLLDPGDEVIIPAPYWVSYPDMVQLADGKPVIVSAPAEAGFKVTVAQLDKSKTAKTKALVVNSPSNPTGACYSQAEIDAIAQWAVDNKIVLIADEIYDQLVYAPAKHGTFSTWWEKHPDSFVICGGVSKTYAMTGWRVGHVMANIPLSKAMSKLQSQTTSNVCSIAQKAALAAYTGGMDAVNAMRSAFQRRRDLALDIIGTWKGVYCPKPDGAFYIFPDVHGVYTSSMPDSMAFCEQVLEKAGVALVPGKPFGDDNCVRMSYAVSDEMLTQALERIGKFLYK